LEGDSTDIERVTLLQNILINRATGQYASNEDYQFLRKYFLGNPSTKPLVPSWLQSCRDLDQFWHFIKPKFPSYAERRSFIWKEFSQLIEYFEENEISPHDQTISEVLKNLNSESVNIIWAKALERRQTDPEGAITIAKTLLETICKHILDDKAVEYNESTADLPALYHLVSNVLNLAPSQYSEQVFKQILGGCTSIIHGLGALRNQFGDAHGKGKKIYKPAPRHAELAVNLAGAVSIYIVETWKARNLNDES